MPSAPTLEQDLSIVTISTHFSFRWTIPLKHFLSQTLRCKVYHRWPARLWHRQPALECSAIRIGTIYTTQWILFARHCILCLKAVLGTFAAPTGKFRGFFLMNMLRLFSRVKIAAPIVLAQHKGHERIGRARRRACYALPGVTELPYEVLSGHGKVFSTR